ncbi:unnamed protein product [Paramecium primaurelia]|uniref:Uncharacterized protein n=1 Tax=Paramecium primaurelia TaxID=5886 RepID=A0A8S1PFW1_PARPR|nr:unnamed protein product [Paramecium primaurelia]
MFQNTNRVFCYYHYIIRSNNSFDDVDIIDVSILIVHKLHPTMIIDVEPIKLNKLQNLANLDMSYDSTMLQQ